MSHQNSSQMNIYQLSDEFQDMQDQKNLYNSSKNREENEKIDLNSSCKVSNIPLLKNKYISKIQTIRNQLGSNYAEGKQDNVLGKKGSSISLQYSNGNPPSNNMDDGTSSVNQGQTNRSVSAIDKKQRNKQSAKQSRDRKKLYIQMLQQKQKTLTKKLLSRKKQLQQTKNYLDRVVNQNKTLSGFTASRQQMIKKLDNILNDKELTPQNRDKELNKIMDNLRYKIGATGKERINTINQYFRQIVNLSLPALHRYMMWSASQQNHLFSENDEEETDEWYKELKAILNLTQEQKTEVKSKKAFLQEQKQVLQKLILKLKTIKTEIQQKSIELQDIIDGVRQILTPIQCANFILFIEKNKYRKELNLCDQIEQEGRQRIKQNSEEMDKGTRKIVKTEDNSS